MILPVVKLGALALKTISKPIASRLKKEAGRNPRFRDLIISVAQVNHLHHSGSLEPDPELLANHRITTNLQRRLYGHSTNVEIRPLDAEKAVQAATDLFGEILIFLVGGGIVIFEVQRSARSEARKEELRKQELQELRQNELELAIKVEMLEQKVAEIQKLAGERGLSGLFKFRQNPQTPETSSAAAAV